MSGLIIGVDEVNYSPSLAGDCVVCALAATGERVAEVADSKVLSSRQRVRLFSYLQGVSTYAIVPATVNAIEGIGVFHARNLAMFFAVQMLGWELAKLGRIQDVGEVVFDGPERQLDAATRKCFRASLSGIPGAGDVGYRFEKDADATVYEVSAASIMAKVYVDALFAGFGKFWPGYGFEKDHGSPSAYHIRGLRELGPSPYHRRRRYAPDWWWRILRKSRYEIFRGGNNEGTEESIPASQVRPPGPQLRRREDRGPGDGLE